MKTDHHSLKYVLEQWLSSPEQHKWVTKMLGYDYEIIYKKDKDNVVVDALSRQLEEDVSLFALLLPSPGWLEDACKEWLANDTLRQLIQHLQVDPNPPKSYTWKRDTLRFKGYIVLVKDLALKQV
jgi:hypothetical protein